MSVSIPVFLHVKKGTGLVSKLIQWQTRSEYSHAKMTVSGRTWEVGGGRRGMDPVKDYVPAYDMPWPTKWDTLVVMIETDQALVMNLWLHKQKGKPYDLPSVIRFVTRDQESRKSAGKWFCSELPAGAFEKVGKPLFRDTEPWEVSPGFLARTPLALSLDEFVERYGLNPRLPLERLFETKMVPEP